MFNDVLADVLTLGACVRVMVQVCFIYSFVRYVHELQRSVITSKRTRAAPSLCISVEANSCTSWRDSTIQIDSRNAWRNQLIMNIHKP